MTKKKIPDPNKPTSAERIRMIREATELNVPYIEVLNRWKKEKGIAAGTARKMRSDAKKMAGVMTAEELKKEDVHAGVYVPPAKDDGPNYEEPSIKVMTRMRIYEYFRKYGAPQTEEQIWSMHRQAMVDPVAFAEEFGEAFTKVIIQL